MNSDNDSQDDFAQYEGNIDFDGDYEPLRLGLKPKKLLIVLEYQIPSSLRVFQHYIQL